MTEVRTEEGQVIQTDLPPEAVSDIQPKVEEKPDTPQKPEPEKAPAEAKAEEPKPEEKPKVEEPKEEPKRPFKYKPIAEYITEKKSWQEKEKDYQTQIAELTKKTSEVAKQPETPQTDDDIKALAEETGVDEALLTRIVNLARKGQEVPKEVQNLLAEREQQKQIDAEHERFDTRVNKLAGVLVGEPILEHKDKLMELAYSTKLAPDGEPYHAKDLAEIYFGYIKPEIAPGKATAEPSRGGTKNTKVLDFAEIDADEAKLEEFAKESTSEQFQAYTKWKTEKQGDVPIKRATSY